jgi:hypothetical protein
MAAPGFTDLPSTQHFAFEFNNQLDEPAARALGKALADTAERDFAIMTGWFGGSAPNGPIDTKINVGSGGASNDNANNINLLVGATADFKPREIHAGGGGDGDLHGCEPVWMEAGRQQWRGAVAARRIHNLSRSAEHIERTAGLA